MRLALVALVCAACGGPQLSEHPAPAVTKFLPATLDVARPKEGDPRVAKVRIYADAAVRANPRWKDEFTEELDYANQLLQPLVGTRLAIESTKDWAFTGDIHTALRALVAADPGDGVAWVIGLVGPGDTASKAFTELGDAATMGKHVVVRAWAEAPETAALAAKLPDAKSAERAEVIAAHKRHKETVILLHGIAATLGAIAETDPTWIQNPTYSPQQASFSDRDRELIAIAMDGRLGEAKPEATAKQLLSVIDKAEWGGWVAADRETVMAALRNIIDAKRSGETAADVPPEAYDQFNRIRELVKRGDRDAALIELNNLLGGYPANATMHALKCEILLPAPAPKGPTPKPGPDALKACARVSELAPGDPNIHMLVAEAWIRALDFAAARKELAQAEGKIGNLPRGAEEAWKKLAGIYQGMGALTWTEDALAKGGLGKDPMAEQIAQTRARYGVPRGAKFVQPADEAALVSATMNALHMVYAEKFGDASHALAAAERKWPGAPGLLAVRCDLALRQSEVGPAKAACDRAIALDPDESWALYLDGVLALQSAGTVTGGIAKLKRAIAVDPDLGQAWRTLAKAYARSGDKAALDALANDYQTKFGSPLPPP
ncbi:MAG TPA: tetratricopeptide repeat protein [Kofleriaceae bacterium]